MIYSSIEELIASTPILKLSRLGAELGLGGEIYAKLESFNPGGSAKDRVARRMLDAAVESGKIKKNTVIIEPTSGNTGIGLALIGAVRGYKTVIVMPDSMSRERILLMKAYGAEVVLTPGKDGMKGAIAKARSIAEAAESAFIPSQFDNPENKRAHFETTGPEIYRDMNGDIDFFVAGIGTGGTISGVGEYLKGMDEGIKIIGVEPSDSAVLSGGAPGPHALQGIGAGFIPAVLNTEIYDGIIGISKGEAYSAARLLARCEGVLAGISSGAALSAAIKLAGEKENRGKKILVLLPDSAERYLSGDLFD